jgi:hypothetical protein
LLSLVLHSLDPGFGFAGWESMRNPEVFLLEHEGDNYEAGAWHLTTK